MVRSFRELINAVIQSVNSAVSGSWLLSGIRYEVVFMSLSDMEAELAGQPSSLEKKTEVVGLEIVGGLPSVNDLDDLVLSLSRCGWKKNNRSLREGDYRKFFFTY